MPFLAPALDPVEIQIQLNKQCRSLSESFGKLTVRSVEVVRYKPGRRCLIEYRLSAPHFSGHSLAVLGKVRAKGVDKQSFRLAQTLWHGHFGPQSADGICVPEPFGTVPLWHMWLQLKVPGTTATRLLPLPDRVSLARRIAEAV